MNLQLESMKMDPSFLSRNVNEGFSGGEKKRNEMLQLAVLEPEVAILDEVDSGLDVDALKDVSEAVNGMRYLTLHPNFLAFVIPNHNCSRTDGPPGTSACVAGFILLVL